MADLDTNGMATHGQGVYTQTSGSSVAFVSEEFQAGGSGVNEHNEATPDFVDLARTSAPAGNNSGVVPGGFASVSDFDNSALKDGLELGPLTGIYDGLLDNPYASFGVSPPPTFYKMRVWNTVQAAFEYWVSEGSPSSANPSGQATLAGSLTVIAVKRPKDLVGQGPS